MTKTYTRSGKGYSAGTYHGTITRVERKPGNKHPSFHCFFDEDQAWDTISYPEIIRILDPDPGESVYIAELETDVPIEAVNVAEEAAEDARADYLPDVVPSRHEMLRQPDAPKFIEAEHVEVQNMERHKVMTWCIPPKGVRLISSKFTYKRKRDKNGAIIKWKARLVARGFTMVFGVDYMHSSSPVASLVAFRLVIAIAVVEGMDISSGDIEGAFLNGDLSEDIDEPLYMRPPAGFEDPTGQGRVFKLTKSIYGLKNASYCWFKLLSSVMRELGYKPVDASECFWAYNDGERKALFVVHVDDYVHAFNDATLDKILVDKFTKLWGVSSVGPLQFYLGMEVNYVKGQSVTVSQRAYFEKLLKRFGFEGMKPVDSPMDPAFKITAADSEGIKALGGGEKKLYMEIVGSLIYAAVITRPDICNAVAQLGRVMNNPGRAHLAAAKRVLRYIAGTLDRGLHYVNKAWTPPGYNEPISPKELNIYADSDWAGDQDTSKSTSGYLTMMAGGIISYRAALQKTQALSSAEAEYVSLSDAGREATYITNVLRELDIIPQGGPIPLYSDSSAAIAMTQYKGVNHRTKHIALRHHFIKSLIDEGTIEVRKIGTEDNPADILTKATDKVTLARHADVCVPYLQQSAR